MAYAETAPAKAQPYRSPRPVEELIVPSGQRVTILQLNEHTCKWPIGDPQGEDFHFCGSRSNSGSPYCERHSRLAYQPVNSSRKRS